MEQLTHWKKMVNPKYLGSHDLFVSDGKYSEQVVEITAVKMEEVVGENNKKDNCLVAHLKGMKPVILNRTNSKTIVKLAQSPAIEKWVGLQVILYVSKVNAFGAVHDAIRIRDHKPTPAVQVDYTIQITAIQATESVEALGALWQGFSADEKSALVKIKDEKKSKLV